MTLLFYLFNTSFEILFQRLIVSIISSSDEDSDISIKDSQSLVNVISLLAHHLEPDGPQVATYTNNVLLVLVVLFQVERQVALELIYLDYLPFLEGDFIVEALCKLPTGFRISVNYRLHNKRQ